MSSNFAKLLELW